MALPDQRVAEEGEQRRRHGHRGNPRVDLVGVDDQRPQGEAGERIGRLHALRVGAEHDQQPVDQDQGDRHQQHELAVLGPVDEGIDQPALHDVAEREQHRGDRHHHRQRVEAIVREQRHRQVHGNGHHLAVGEVDHAHHAEDDRQPERHQPVHEAGQQAADGDVEIDLGGHSTIPEARAPTPVATGAGSGARSFSRACRRRSWATRPWRWRQPWAPPSPACRRGSGWPRSSGWHSGPWRRTGCRGRC